MSPYSKKYDESAYNFEKIKESFLNNDSNFEHCLNNFLSSAQSVFWILNKEFVSKPDYDEWKNRRSERLPKTAKSFKELRNISLKEGPIKHNGVIFDFDFGGAGIVIPPYAEVTSPVIDTHLGKIVSKAQIKTVEGDIYEVEPIVIHDFSVKVESGKKIYDIKYFLHEAFQYINAIKKEIEETERSFKN